jgi:hypothetical protein
MANSQGTNDTGSSYEEIPSGDSPDLQMLKIVYKRRF